jgi:hypothetical protein
MRSFLEIYHNFGEEQLALLSDTFGNISVGPPKPRTGADGRCLAADIDKHAIRPLLALTMNKRQATYFANWVLGIGEFESEDPDGFFDVKFH